MTAHELERFKSLATWEDAPSDIKFLIDLIRQSINDRIGLLPLLTYDELTAGIYKAGYNAGYSEAQEIFG